MIKLNIASKYAHHYVKIKNFNDDVFVADYTEHTRLLPIKRAVEFFSPNFPTDISYFTIRNTPNLFIDGIDFDGQSFVCGNGNSRTQCEGVFFPSVSNIDSWILFCELKYSSRQLQNENNLRKAMKQLYKTRFYYCQDNIISQTNTSYLIASLPMQSEPFANFALSQPFLLKLKRTRNIILRFKNVVEIVDDKLISV
jgi:hypothetical protein